MDEHNYTIYMYTNRANGKVYIGQTKQTCLRRAGKHGEYYKKCPRFNSTIKHYGWENFDLTILYTKLSREEADIKEKELIHHYRDELNISYNVHDGGRSKGKRHNSIETRELISKALKGKNKGKLNGMFGKVSPKAKAVDLYENRILKYSFSSIKDSLNIVPYSTALIISNLIKQNYFAWDKYILIYAGMKIPDNPILYREEHPEYIRIYKYEQSGQLMGEYRSIDSAVLGESISSKTISEKTKNGPTLYKKIIWSRKSLTQEQIKNVLKKSTIFDNKKHEGIPINVYDSSGNLLHQYEKLYDAYKNTKVSTTMISKCYSQPFMTKGFIFTTGDCELHGYELVKQTISAYTMLLLYDEQDKFIKCFSNFNDLKKEIGLHQDIIKQYIYDSPVKYRGYIIRLSSQIENSNIKEIISKKKTIH